MRKAQLRAAAGLSAVALSCAVGPAARADDKADAARIEALTREVEELKALVLKLEQQQAEKPVATSAPAAASSAEVAELRVEVQRLQAQLATSQAAPINTIETAQAPEATQTPPEPNATIPPGGPKSAPAKIIADALKGVTINGELDTYYEYNTNAPFDRMNQLRAFDVSSNTFALNQADLIVESAPEPENGKRFGMRIDLQYGQATETLQGNPANEPRPEIYRNIFQAYGTYIFPVGNGLTVDFGKWASSLGYEGNYTKDQLNYSRSFWFNFLPFYHSGLRVKYPITDAVAANLWIVNGVNQSEPFNNYKDQLYGLVITPSPAASWTINYYRGQEHPDVLFLAAQPPDVPPLPDVQGTFIEPIANPPTGLLNIGDTYASLQVTPALLFAAEADYVSERLFRSSPAETAYGGALYVAYLITPQVAMAARTEYLADRGGLFSGVTQDLKEGTLTFDWRPADGFRFFGEYRIDSSDRPFFLTPVLGRLTLDQPTIGFGAVWWFGQKPSPW